MYLAELHGKLPPAILRMEDTLTSDVFSFFKYASRTIFLRAYLTSLGLKVSGDDARKAEFLFWPRFEENTEPDLVIMVGKYYLVIEAKYFSDFSEGTHKSKAQLIREIEGGHLQATNYRRKFKYVAITADHYYKKDKFRLIPSEVVPDFIWTNWQHVSSFLNTVLENEKSISTQEKEFCYDLYRLLDKKCLRDYQGLKTILKKELHLAGHQYIFFDARTADYRGDFLGFTEVLSFAKRIFSAYKVIFFSPVKEGFSSLSHFNKLMETKKHIFYQGEPSDGRKSTSHGTDKSCLRLFTETVS